MAKPMRDDWEAHDAMHTLMRAGEIIGNKPLLKRVRKKAAEHAEKMSDVAQRAGKLAKMGRISEKQMAKIGGGAKGGGARKETAKLEKMTPIA